MTYTMQKLLPTIIMKYDLVNNILGITNTADPQNIAEKNKAKVGGAYSHSYVYDDINRLISADGKAKTASYRLDMTYGIMGEPLTKKQKVDSSKVAQSYAFAYLYEDSDHPTAPSQIGHNHYTYDANGNPTLVENDSLNTERRMYWDEDNRLMVLSDNGKTSRYTYNAAGERIVKSHGDLEGVYVNGAPQGMTFHETEDYTIYPAPIITVTKNLFTKHYFVGDKRVASKLGVGKFSNVYGISSNNVTAGQKDYAARMLQIEKQREEYYKSLGTPPGVPTMKGATADPDNTGYGYNTIIGELGDHSVPEGWVQRPKFNDKGDVPGPPIQWQKPEDPDNAQPGYGYVPADTTNTEEIFFYHSDHLGSTSYITDAKANITQFDAYLPYGELLVDEHSSSEEMPYKFNGKEFDQETGLYYYGARYMDPKISMWLGVDPLAEKYPNVTGYCYTMDNPIKFIEIDGKDWILSTGNRVYWYGGKYGNRKNLIAVYKATSGMASAIKITTLPNGKRKQETINPQQAKYQRYSDIGPTPEGKYKINLSPDPDRIAEADPHTGALKRNVDGGIERIPDFVENTENPGSRWTYAAWGKNRARLEPIEVTGATAKDRDLNSFYFHDSEKGYSHGCTEVESALFTKLREYREEGNQSIEVMVDYPNRNHRTNGGTKKEKKSE